MAKGQQKSALDKQQQKIIQYKPDHAYYSQLNEGQFGTVANSKVFLENNSKIIFVTSNKGQSLLALNNYIYKCNKRIQKNIGYVSMPDLMCTFIQMQIRNI